MANLVRAKLLRGWRFLAPFLVVFLTALFGLQIALADTLPGTAGNPSPQVITVQGCTGCVSVGGGGGGGGTNSFPYNNGFAQTATANSAVAVGGFNTGGSFDPFFTSPTGTTISLGQPGAQLITGGGPSGTVPVSLASGPYNICDPTTSTQCMAVDTVGASYQNPEGKLGTSTLGTAVGATVSIPTYGYSQISFYLPTGWTGSNISIGFLLSPDNTNFLSSAYCTSNSSVNSASTSSTSGNLQWTCQLNGAGYFEWKSTGTNGLAASAAITWHLSAASSNLVTLGGIAIGANQGATTQTGVPTGLNVTSATAGYNVANTQTVAIGADPGAGAPLFVTTGGTSTCSVAAATTTVCKASAGRLAGIMITASGSGTLICYDNATTGSGLILATFAATPTVGATETPNFKAANGITCVAGTGTTATLGYF